MPTSATGRSDPVRSTSPRRTYRSSRVSTRVAWMGLCLVIVALTAFAGVSAVVIARAAAEARSSADIREVSVKAYESLLPLEDFADDVVERPSAETRTTYRVGAATAAAALEALERVHNPLEAQAFEQTMTDFWEYKRSVQQMFVIAEQRPDLAVAFEERLVDPPYEAVLTFVTEDADLHWRETSDALEVLAQTQELLLTAWFVVAGLALVPLFVFTRALRRHRREILLQAKDNHHQALHDPLTGLPNRTLLQQRAEIVLEAAEQGGHSMALLIVDLDRFKEINDTLGHHYGDVVLKALAPRLRSALRANDTVARLGGDEFAVVLPSVEGVDAALDVAMKVRRAIEQGIESDGLKFTVEASVGVVLSGMHGNDVDTLMRHADIAMYVAKERGIGVCVYEEDLNGHSLARLGLLGELRRAIDGEQLVVHYQPKVSLSTGDVCGVEALVRWNHPDRGVLLPAAFIPMAEQTGLIRPLTRYVIDASLAQCRVWQDAGRNHKVAVNISARNLLDDQFVVSVQQLLAKWRLAPSCLELEVTESAIMVDPPGAQATLGALSSLGVTLAIDDFGAGYTSLAHLKNLPVNVLKIDQSFISQITGDTKDAAIVRALIDLAHDLGLLTVAEGVEDRRTLDRLAALGCDLAQGYHLSPPVPARLLESWFDRTSTAALVTSASPHLPRPVALDRVPSGRA